MDMVRRLDKEDFADYGRIQESAYPQFKSMIRQDFYDFVTSSNGMDHYGLERDGVLAGLYRYYCFEMNVAGRMLPVAGIGSVAVDAPYKRDHVCLGMIRQYHNLAAGEGRSLSALYPFNSAFYRKMGYGFGTRMYSFRINACNLRRYEGVPRLRYLAPTELDEFIGFHRRKVSERHGMMYKLPELLSFVVQNGLLRYKLAVVEDAGAVRGYIAYSYSDPIEGSLFAYNMEILDMQYDRREDLWALLDFVAAQSQQVRNVFFKTPDEDLFFVFAELGHCEIPQRVYGPGTELGEFAHGMMYRILDLRRLMNDLSSGRFGKGAMRLCLNIEDDMIEANNGKFTYQFENGSAVPSDAAPDATLSMNIADFSSLLMGAVSLDRLYELKLADIDRIEMLPQANDVFSYPVKPVSWTTF